METRAPPRPCLHRACSLFSFWESVQTKLWIPAIVPQHPNPDMCAPNVVQKMIRESIQIAAPEPTPVKMEILRILNHLPNPDLKLCKEIITELLRYAEILVQNRVQICLNTPVESSVHGSEARQRVRRK